MPLILPRASTLGTYTAPVDDAVARTVVGRIGEVVSVKDFGALGDGVADDTEALQKALVSGRRVHFPRGEYRITAALLYDPTIAVVWTGEYGMVAGGSPTVSIFDARPSSAGDEPMIHHAQGWMRQDGTFAATGGGDKTNSFTTGRGIFIERIAFQSWTNLYSACVEIQNCRFALISECTFQYTFRGLTFGPSTFEGRVAYCSFWGFLFTPNRGAQNWETTPDIRDLAIRAWGLYGEGIVVIGCHVQGGGCGFYLSGMNSTLINVRVETAGWGIVLGYGRWEPGLTGRQAYGWDRSAILGSSLEANAIGVYVHQSTGSSISSVTLQGSPIAEGRTHNSEIGWWFVQGPLTSACSAIGYFAEASVINRSRQPVNVSAANWAPGAPLRLGHNRAFSGGLGAAAPDLTFAGVRYPIFPGASNDRHGSVTAWHDMMLFGLTGFNARDRAPAGSRAEGGAVFSKNLGGSVAVSAEATTAVVAFEPAVEQNQVVFNGTGTVVDDVASELEAGTYTYATTVLSRIGETPAQESTWRTLEIGSGQKASLPLSGNQNWYSRRVYRSQDGGETWEGYWQNSPGVHGTFVDDGARPFDGMDEPAKTGLITSRHEDDEHYQIIATPSWATTVHVTAKATTGFTLNFGTAAPEGATCAWLLFRP